MSTLRRGMLANSMVEIVHKVTQNQKRQHQKMKFNGRTRSIEAVSGIQKSKDPMNTGALRVKKEIYGLL